MGKTFVPKMVGNPDHESIKQITGLYDEISYLATSMKEDLNNIFVQSGGVSLEFFMDFIKSNPEKFIRSKWVEFKNISIPGISTEKLIESNLLDIPNYSETIKCRRELDKLLLEAKLKKFNYSLEDLYNENNGGFELTEEFNSSLLESFTVYTTSEEQNEVLEVFEQLCDSVNKLCNLGLLKPTNLGIIHEKYYGYVLKRTLKPKDPFQLNREMFQKSVLKHTK